MSGYFEKSRSAPGSNMLTGYLESRLTSVHNKSAQSVVDYKWKLGIFIMSVVSLTLIPYVHIGIFYMKLWVPGKSKIDRDKCRCSCFDTIMRGEYEDPGPGTKFKHVYFNATWQTMRIWMFTVIFILLAYESIKYITPLVTKRKVRMSMFVLYLANIYPHYYSWWSYFSYYNEDFYTYFRHHMLFTITEIIASCMVLNLCDKRNVVVSWKVFIIMAINLMHILIQVSDQFIDHVLLRKGTGFQNARNIGLMVPDLLHVCIPFWLLYRHAKEEGMTLSEMIYKEEIFLCILFISFGTLIGRLM